MPSRYPVYVLLAEEHHWTPAQVDDMPADYVDEMLTRIQARRKAEAKRHDIDKSKAKANAAKGKKR